MGSRRVLIDTSILIEYFRKRDKTKTLLFKLIKNDYHLAVSTITYFEYLNGSANELFSKKLFSIIEIKSFDEFQSKKASEIFKDLKRKNLLVDFRDILIAACALCENIPLCTLNIKHFTRIENLTILNNPFKPQSNEDHFE